RAGRRSGRTRCARGSSARGPRPARRAGPRARAGAACPRPRRRRPPRGDAAGAGSRPPRCRSGGRRAPGARPPGRARPPVGARRGSERRRRGGRRARRAWLPGFHTPVPLRWPACPSRPPTRTPGPGPRPTSPTTAPRRPARWRRPTRRPTRRLARRPTRPPARPTHGRSPSRTRRWDRGRPGTLVFDERYYVKQGWTLLRAGFEANWPEEPNPAFEAGDVDSFLPTADYVVHPPLGKWMIALGMRVLGGAENPW